MFVSSYILTLSPYVSALYGASCQKQCTLLGVQVWLNVRGSCSSVKGVGQYSSHRVIIFLCVHRVWSSSLHCSQHVWSLAPSGGPVQERFSRVQVLVERLAGTLPQAPSKRMYRYPYSGTSTTETAGIPKKVDSGACIVGDAHIEKAPVCAEMLV